MRGLIPCAIQPQLWFYVIPAGLFRPILYSGKTVLSEQQREPDSCAQLGQLRVKVRWRKLLAYSRQKGWVQLWCAVCITCYISRYQLVSYVSGHVVEAYYYYVPRGIACDRGVVQLVPQDVLDLCVFRSYSSFVYNWQ